MAEISNEETELTQEFGQLVRVLTGSSMQLREAALRGVSSDFQAHEDQRQQEQQRQQQQLLAESVNEKLRSEELWARQDPTEIADHVIVSAHLGQTNETALSGYAYASDMLRDNYGINLAEMNKDHPTAWADQHTALQQALADHYQAQQKEQEAQQESTQSETEQVASTVEDRLDNLLSESELTADGTQDQLEAAAARQSEQAHLQAAEGHAAEQHQDAGHAQQEASTGGRQPDPYQRVSDTQRDHLNERNPGYGDIRQRHPLRSGDG